MSAAPALTLTDRLKDEVACEIEGRRDSIDHDDSLSRVTIIVQIDPSTGRIVALAWRPEYQRSLRVRRPRLPNAADPLLLVNLRGGPVNR